MSALEDAFAAAWKMHGRGSLITEFQFSDRKYRFDFANEASKVAVEMDGGSFGRGKPCPTCGQKSAGRHSRPMGFHGDCDKSNLAAAAGWVTFRFTAKHIKECPVQCIEMVSAAIELRTPRKESA